MLKLSDINLEVSIDEELKEVINPYLTARKEEIHELKHFVQENDFEKIAALAHNMKGTGAGFGFDVISQIGKALEQSAKSKDLPSIELLISQLNFFVHQVRIRYVQDI